MGDPSSTPPGDVHRMSVGRARKGRATFVYRDPTVLGSRDTVLRGRGTTRPVISADHNEENWYRRAESYSGTWAAGKRRPYPGEELVHSPNEWNKTATREWKSGAVQSLEAARWKGCGPKS